MFFFSIPNQSIIYELYFCNEVLDVNKIADRKNINVMLRDKYIFNIECLIY